MTKIIYIHGFQGGGPSIKIDRLQKEFPGDIVTPKVSQYRLQAFYDLHDCIYKYKDDAILVGTSLGGFWAGYFSHVFNIKALMLNPCLDPSVSLKKYAGQKVGEYIWSKEDANDYSQLVPLDLHDGVSRIILCEAGDTVIDPSHTHDLIDWSKPNCPKWQVLPAGSHRFENHTKMVNSIRELMKMV